MGLEDMIVTIADVLDLTELREIRGQLDRAAFGDGAVTAGERAKRVKKNLQLRPGETDVRTRVKKALMRHPEFKKAVLPKNVRPPLINRYETGMEYGFHVDNAIMGDKRDCRSDVSVTLFLNGPEAYEGGTLEIETPLGVQQVKLPAGAAVLYPSSFRHRVSRVESGQRLAAVTWAQSLVRDPAQREILYELDRIRTYLHQAAPDGEEADIAERTYSNLLRMWAET